MRNRLFSEEELENAAFYLLTSSTVDRYVRIAEREARNSDLWQRIRRESCSIDLVHQGRELWKQVVRSRVRDVSEIERALLLCILSYTAIPEVDDFLLGLAAVDHPTTAWISALGRRLLERRPGEKDFFDKGIFGEDRPVESNWEFLIEDSHASSILIPHRPMVLTCFSPQASDEVVNTPLYAA